MRTDKVFHVISNTHWDREWRFPFQRNRQMLVDMIDSVLDILEKEPKYRAFHLDSQSIVIKDYLEIKPYKKELIKNLVKQNRLLIGPWYILPEEFQVGGENLIRNLLLGHKVCNEHGGVSKIGYSPFSWGQISQLPQIYKEFGINLIMFYRGVNSIDSPKAEFLWEGADGTKAISSRFSTMPRYNFYFYIYRPAVHNEGFYDVEYKWSKGGKAFHFADKEQFDEDFFIIDPLDEYYEENLKEWVEKIVKDQADDFTTPHAIWMEGHDSSGPNIKTVRIIEDIKKIFPDINIKHSTLEEYAKAVFESSDEKELKLVKGERRSSQFDRRSGNMYGYTTSARMFLKQRNFDAERWIQFYAEPFNSFAGILGKDIKDHYLETSWEMIIQNSAHDSIGGCSLDEIHADMMNRYKQSIEISKGVFERAIKYISKRIDTSAFGKSENKNDIFITVFNPNNYERNEVVKSFIDIPKEYDLGDFDIISSEGSKIEKQLISSKPFQPVLEQMIDRPMYFDMQRYEAYLNANDIPAFGYNTFKVVPKKRAKAGSKGLAKIKKGSIVLENEFVKVNLNSNGTFDLIQKEINHKYKNLGYFYDEGEAGHAWVNTPTKPFVDTLENKAKIKIIENGKLSSTIKISNKIKIYKNLSDRLKKSKKLKTTSIYLYLIINKTSKRIDLKVEVDNNAESHRLRMMFPTNLKTNSSFGEGQFDVVERSLERPNTKDWIEQPMYDFPMHQFVDLTDKEKGLAVLVDGLKEYEVLSDKKRTLAITLFRGFEFIIAPSSKQDYTYQKGSQCLGKQEFRLALFPHKSDWQNGEVYNEALNFNNSLRIAQISSGKGDLPITNSLLKIENENVVFSSLKKSQDNAENSYVLRVYNPTIRKQKTKISFCQNIKSAQQVTLEEIAVCDLELTNDNSFMLELEKKKIMSVKVWF